MQDWIVSHGRRTIQHVQDDPDNLVELMPDRHNARIDWFGGLTMEAHIAVTGRPFAVDGPDSPDEPLGTAGDLTDEILDDGSVSPESWPTSTPTHGSNACGRAQPAEHAPPSTTSSTYSP
ncbi:hypothetical protein [Salinispora arenicola]|uniref:hypothetical protein n=1 Tax=Salinispora arenicola TaxID=168697 RepID=UPI0027DB9662|nr:hypothetical protein [Salinispora arenicola]